MSNCASSQMQMSSVNKAKCYKMKQCVCAILYLLFRDENIKKELMQKNTLTQ